MTVLRLTSLITITALAVAASAGCSAEPPAEETTSTSSSVTTATNVSRALAYGKSLIGTPYGWWYSGGIPEGEPMWAASGAPPSADDVYSTNCAGLTNLMLRYVGKEVPGYGGTGSYGDYYWDVSEYFDPYKDYPPGTLLGRYYRDTYDQGHVAVVIEGGYVLQSYANCYGCSYPGVNDWSTVAASHDGYYYEYAVLPENWLGGTGGSNSGDCAWGDGYYCGGNGVTGDEQTLYKCSGGSASVSQKCSGSCVAEAAGVDDHCGAASDNEPTGCDYGDGYYCGGNGVTGDKSTLYSCWNGVPTVYEKCAKGCAAQAAGIDDYCN
jgi:cell wall-associated NlpC family hydrolase